MNEQQEYLIKLFTEKSERGMKDMIDKGWYPDNPLWGLGKLNLSKKLSKELKVPISFDESFDRTMFYSNLPLLRNNDFLLKLVKLYEIKNKFKRWHIIDGHRFWVKKTKKMFDILRNYECLTEYEPETTKLVKEYVKPGMTCVDVGASIGYFTLLLARQVGETGRVIAIEPTDFQQRYIKRNVKVNGYKKITTIVNVGAWDKDEIIKMPRNAPPFVQTELRCRPVDDILEELGIMKIDFIKIDVDGPEPNVLKGLIRTIERSPDMMMVIEYYPKYIRDAGLNPDDFMAIINKYFTYEVIPGDYTDGCWNYLCKRKI